MAQRPDGSRCAGHAAAYNDVHADSGDPASARANTPAACDAASADVCAATRAAADLYSASAAASGSAVRADPADDSAAANVSAASSAATDATSDYDATAAASESQHQPGRRSVRRHRRLHPDQLGDRTTEERIIAPLCFQLHLSVDGCMCLADLLDLEDNLPAGGAHADFLTLFRAKQRRPN